MPTITYLSRTREAADFPAIPAPIKAALINAAALIANNPETDNPESEYIAIETLEGIGFSVSEDSEDSIKLEFTSKSDYPVGNPYDYNRAEITRDYSLVIPFSDFPVNNPDNAKAAALTYAVYILPIIATEKL